MSLDLHDRGCSLMASLTVEIGLTASAGGWGLFNVGLFDAATFGPGEVWVDISQWVMSFAVTRKFADRLRLWQAGSCTLELSNMDGRFSPDNLTGPYAAAGFSSIRPGIPIRANVTISGVVYWLFCGTVDTWAEDWPGHIGARTGGASVTVTALDAWKTLSTFQGAAVTPVGAGETLGPRISRILTTAGYVGPIDLDTGTIPLQETTLADKPLDEIDITIASEGGAVYVAADGRFCVRDRYSLTEDLRSVTPQVVFGDSAGEVPWSALGHSPLTLSGVVNYARYTAPGSVPTGLPQVSYDSDSMARFGQLSDEASWRDKLICVNDSDVAVLAQWTVATRKDAQQLITSISAKPRSNYAVLLPKLFGLEVRDLVSVTIRPPSATSHVVSRLCFVSGIEFKFDEGDIDFVIGTESATIWNTYALSRFDYGTFGASVSDPSGARFFI